jgi:cytoskeletal protein CcmA (bactofilin family)
MNETRLRRLRDKSASSATLINEGCKITGTISGTGSYLVNGEIDGDCQLDGTVTIAPNGLWKGTIKASDVIVAGQVEGDIIATGKVEITDCAHIIGTVSGEAIAVAEGAVVEGVMKTTGPAEPLEFVEKRKED